jgi:hypothetical protein
MLILDQSRWYICEEMMTETDAALMVLSMAALVGFVLAVLWNA